MNLVKELIKSRADVATFISLRCIGETNNDSIIKLSKVSDVYVYIDIPESKINVMKYCNIYPISGYSSGAGSSTEGLLNLMKDVSDIDCTRSRYQFYYLPKGSIIEYNGYLDKLLYSNILDKSIFQCNKISEEELMKVYLRSDWDERIYRLKKIFRIPTDTDIDGMYRSYTTLGDAVIRSSDFSNMIGISNDNPSYLKSFYKYSIFDLIASSFMRYHFDFVNYNPCTYHRLKE